MLTLVISDSDASVPATARKVNEWRDDFGEVCARAHTWKDSKWIDWPGLGLFAFSAGSLKVRVWPEPTVKHEAIIDAFSRTVEPVILQDLGWQALHAGAAVGPGGVLAFCGRKGSGKSTLAYAMGQAGWRQFADDALVLRFDRDCVMTCPLRFKPRLRPASYAHFMRARAPSPSALEPADLPLAAVFLLRQNSDLLSPRVSLMPRGQAFSKLLAHAHCFDPADPKHARQLAEDYLVVVARVPVFALEYRHDLQQLSQVTRAVVEAASSINADGLSLSELQPADLLS